MSTKTELDDFIVFELNKGVLPEEEIASDDANQEEILGVADQFNHSIHQINFSDVQEEASQSNLFDQTAPDDNSAEDTEETSLKTEKRRFKKNDPKRYMLFDELVAIVVDYDNDGSPIVEFALADDENDAKLPVECGICPDIMHKSRLTKHLKKHKVPGTNRYACIYCDETYKDYKYLAGHSRRHMGIRPYVCEPCKLYFSTKQDLRVHNQRRHHKKEHVCEICGKSFSQNTMLKRHRESTHEKKHRFQCEHCPKAYYKNFSLQEHVRAIHMGKRRMLVCPFCGMQCRDAHKMARHRKQLHLNQKEFICEVCQEAFTDINYFDAHKRSIQCRNNTRRRLEEDREEHSMQDFESEQLDDEELQEDVRYQEGNPSNELVYHTLLTDDNVEEIDLNSEAHGDQVVIYDFDMEDENEQ